MRLGLSERSVRRLRARVERDGPAGLVHGNRGRAPVDRRSEEARARIVDLAAGRYAGLNDSHLAELLPAHPWRRVAPGTKLHTMIKAEQEERSGSLSS